MSKLGRNTKQDMEAARKLLHLAKADLQRVMETSSLASADAPGFQPKINAHRMGPAPPRPVEYLSKEETWEYFGKLLDELITCCDVTKVKILPRKTYNTFISS